MGIALDAGVAGRIVRLQAECISNGADVKARSVVETGGRNGM